MAFPGNGNAPIQVEDELIRVSCRTLDDAMRLCLAVSGRSLKEVAWDCGWRDGGRVLRRILNVNNEDADRRYMPHEKWIPFMVACRNAVPLRWLAMTLMPEGMETAAAGRPEEIVVLRTMLAEIRDEVRALREAQTGASFSVTGPAGLPEWLIAVAEKVSVVADSRRWS
jgi:hypothetical protein